MSTYGTVHRLSSSSASMTHGGDESRSKPKRGREFVLLQYFGIPSSPEAAAVRIIRNLGYFRVYYLIALWVILFVSLVPRRRISVIFLVTMTAVTCLYLFLLRLVPNSVILHKIIDPRLVLALLAIITVVELILTRAIIHLLVSLAIALPIVLVHAILRVRDDLFVNEGASAAGELVPLVQGKVPDMDSPA